MPEFIPVALITGASAGIGNRLARLFAADGETLVLVARRRDRLDSLADAIAADGRARPHVIGLDLARPRAGNDLAAALEARGLTPRHVVNNAGFGLLGAAADSDRERQLAMIDLNVRLLTDLSLRWTDSLARHRGGILNVASIAAFTPGPGMAVYHATKAYVLSFSQALHAELEPRGIRVTALCPGPVPTEFMARAGVPPGYFPTLMTRSAERVAREGYEGFMAGRRMVVPGAVNRGYGVMTKLMPRGLLLRFMAGRASQVLDRSNDR